VEKLLPLLLPNHYNTHTIMKTKERLMILTPGLELKGYPKSPLSLSLSLSVSLCVFVCVCVCVLLDECEILDASKSHAGMFTFKRFMSCSNSSFKLFKKLCPK
jgi:hypothetical protein